MNAADLQRDAEVRALGLLDVDVPDVVQRLVVLAARLTGAASAEVNVITADMQHTVASAFGSRTSIPAAESFCATIVREPQRHHVVPDARLDPRFATHEATLSGQVASYAASQLVTASGIPVGTLCVYDARPGVVDESTFAVLQELSQAVVDLLDVREHQDAMRSTLVELTDGSRELRRSNEHLAAFAGQVSHDILGPLSAVLMALQLIDDDLRESRVPAAPHRVELLRRAITASERMEAMVSGLMEFAALGGRISATRVDMDGAVKDVLVDLGAAAGEAHVEVGELPALWGDEVQLRALLQNLLANAFKYAGGTSDTRIRVSGERSGGRVRISVGDNGPGVPPSERASIFGIMVRGSEAGTGDVEGLGIGLATCRRIAQAHGGDIGVTESAEGGAEFWFELPDEGDR